MKNGTGSPAPFQANQENSVVRARRLCQFRAVLAGPIAIAIAIAVSVAIPVAILGTAFDGDDLLSLVGSEYADALVVATGDTPLVLGGADQLAGIRDQHDLIGLLLGEGGRQRTVALVDGHGCD